MKGRVSEKNGVKGGVVFHQGGQGYSYRKI